ncbi:MAG: glycosyltransferase family 39 protein [Candidatus Woesearchaeota archaeon]|jgi:hypothetical protein|nr:glycosyltransferase family 39 protein [Candidatus Woesearchaeota archaeon]
MGKYIFSAGKLGLWESSRPLIWPTFLGTIWKLGLNPIISGRILELTFSLGLIHLTFIVGKEVFNEKIALLSAFFLAFSQTFLSYSSTILTAIPSTFFALLSVYFLIKNKYSLSGLFIGISFMTRFLQLFILIPIVLILLYFKKLNLKKLIKLSYGSAIVVIPCLIINYILYQNPLHPFLLQTLLTKYTGWIYHQPFQFYFINLFKENFLVLFSLVGLFYIFKEKNNKQWIITSIFITFFLFFTSTAHKEMRFTLVFLPYLYLITSFGLVISLKNLKSKRASLFLLISLILLWSAQSISQTAALNYAEPLNLNNYLKDENIKGNIWITSPLQLVNTNKKADELIYYPLYNSEKIDQLIPKLSSADHILIDTCDILPCPPDDLQCTEKTTQLLDSIKEKFNLVYNKKENNCEKFIFSSSS